MTFIITQTKEQAEKMANDLNDFVLFEEPYTIRKKMPCMVSMKSLDNKLPPDSILEKGADSIRTYWNSKNKRKRVR